MKTGRSILLVIWAAYCLIGIGKNFWHYSFWDYVVAIFVAVLPYVIVIIYDKKKNKGSSHIIKNTSISLDDTLPSSDSSSDGTYFQVKNK